MKYKIGDRIYLPAGVGFHGGLENKYGYVTGVTVEDGVQTMIRHTVIGDNGELIKPPSGANSWRTYEDSIKCLVYCGDIFINKNIKNHSF